MSCIPDCVMKCFSDQFILSYFSEENQLRRAEKMDQELESIYKRNYVLQRVKEEKYRRCSDFLVRIIENDRSSPETIGKASSQLVKLDRSRYKNPFLTLPPFQLKNQLAFASKALEKIKKIEEIAARILEKDPLFFLSDDVRGGKEFFTEEKQKGERDLELAEVENKQFYKQLREESKIRRKEKESLQQQTKVGEQARTNKEQTGEEEEQKNRIHVRKRVRKEVNWDGSRWHLRVFVEDE